ncbi:MAG: hypothetical protein QM784_31450 [Polyangiaceae bacterium]
MGLSSTSGEPNVIFAEPEDAYVFEGASNREALAYVAAAQACVDLLTQSGRNAAKGEVLLEWMRANESDWRKLDTGSRTPNSKGH